MHHDLKHRGYLLYVLEWPTLSLSEKNEFQLFLIKKVILLIAKNYFVVAYY